jgi:RimJ/RimL family protein N-acetyltransferase
MATGEEILPERLTGPRGLLLRGWLPEDVLALSDAVAESSEHLRPWMAWIGWVHPHFTRRGLATTAVRLLTDTALTLPGITHVEIHHDKANVASAGVPRRLGFWLLAEVPDEIEAPAEFGVECQWRMDQQRWARRALR